MSERKSVGEDFGLRYLNRSLQQVGSGDGVSLIGGILCWEFGWVTKPIYTTHRQPESVLSRVRVGLLGYRLLHYFVRGKELGPVIVTIAVRLQAGLMR
jgi:hypothetical protein